jgi:hypothetical protein
VQPHRANDKMDTVSCDLAPISRLGRSWVVHMWKQRVRGGGGGAWWRGGLAARMSLVTDSRGP